MTDGPARRFPVGAMTSATVAVMLAACGSTPATTVTRTPAVPQGSSASTGAPAGGTQVIPFADCSRVEFGPVLAPLNPPANVHVYPAVPPISINVARLYQMTITTPDGQIVVCLQPELAPATVNVVVTLVRNHFYDGVIFHRVVPNFVLQGGDPTGTGTGGPGFAFNDEPVHNAYVLGAVAMANQGANTNGSDFFMCIGTPPSAAASAIGAPAASAVPTATAGVTGSPSAPGSSPAPVAECRGLPPRYNLFGKIESGLDVADTITPGTPMTTVVVCEQI